MVLKAKIIGAKTKKDQVSGAQLFEVRLRREDSRTRSVVLLREEFENLSNKKITSKNKQLKRRRSEYS